MANQAKEYEIRPFPIVRRLVIDSGRNGKRKRSVTALVEMDVTIPRQLIEDHKKKCGESLSFTAYIIYCLGKIISENRIVQARRDFWGRLFVFNEVDCAVMVEIDFRGHKFPLAHVLRLVDKRSYRSIHDELREVQNDPQASVGFQINQNLITLFLLMPWFLRDIVYWIGSKSPRAFKKRVGTVIVSAVGMHGKGGGWGLGTGSLYTTGVLIGGISQKPGVVNGEIKVRDYLHITLDFDHDIIDGAPIARFISQFKELVENGYGLEELQ